MSERSEAEILGENDPALYREAADRVTAGGHEAVWVVQVKTADEWRVSAVLTSYDDADAYADDLRDFHENCPEGAEEHGRTTVRIQHGSRRSPTKLYETWPPDGSEVDR